MAFTLSDLDSAIAWWRSEDIPSGTPDPLNWDDAISSWRLSASGSARPSYLASAINGLPGLDFNGTANKMTTTTSKSIAAGRVSFAVVVQPDTLKNYNSLFSLHTGSAPAYDSTQRLRGLGYSNGSVVVSAASGVTPLMQTTHSSGTAPLAAASPRVIVGMCNQLDAIVSSDGVPCYGPTTLNLINFPASTVYASLGTQGLGGDWLDGKLCEVFLWTEPADVLLWSHRFHVEGYLAHKYGRTLPTGHPFYAAAPTSPPSSGSTTAYPIRGPKVLTPWGTA